MPLAKIQDEGALFRAKTVSDILSVVSKHFNPAEAKIWCLPLPSQPNHQTMLTVEGREPVNPDIARQIRNITIPLKPRSIGRDSWDAQISSQSITALGKQFAWAKDTVLLAPVWHEREGVAILGISGQIPVSRAKALFAKIQAAVGTLAKNQWLLQETAIYRFLLSCHNESLVVVRSGGEVVSGTETGLEILNKIEFGNRRSPYKGSKRLISGEITAALMRSKRPVVRGYVISSSPFRDANLDLVEPIHVLDFCPATAGAVVWPPFEPRKVLTPTQWEIYLLLIRGLSYKEIGLARGNSRHTVHHHVSEILRKLNCSDRIQLLARASMWLALNGASYG